MPSLVLWQQPPSGPLKTYVREHHSSACNQPKTSDLIWVPGLSDKTSCVLHHLALFFLPDLWLALPQPIPGHTKEKLALEPFHADIHMWLISPTNCRNLIRSVQCICLTKLYMIAAAPPLTIPSPLLFYFPYSPYLYLLYIYCTFFLIFLLASLVASHNTS